MLMAHSQWLVIVHVVVIRLVGQISIISLLIIIICIVRVL